MNAAKETYTAFWLDLEGERIKRTFTYEAVARGVARAAERAGRKMVRVLDAHGRDILAAEAAWDELEPPSVNVGR